MRKHLVLLLICCGANVEAQSTRASYVCWRARPLANCKTWLITEAGLEWTRGSGLLARTNSQSASWFGLFGSDLAFTGGGMANIAGGQDLGLTVSSTGAQGTVAI